MEKQQEENKTEGKLIKTYAEDMAHVIEDDQGGLIKKIIHEQEMKEMDKKNQSPISQINKIYIALSFIFLVATLMTFMFLFLHQKNASVIVEPQFTPIIFNDKSVFLEISDLPREKVIESVVNEVRKSSVKEGGIESIYLTKNKQIMGLRSFLSLIKSSLVLPDPVFVEDNFMTGVFNGEDKDFFVLIKMRSFQDLFDNFRNWEEKMFYDLHNFFGFPVNTTTNYLLTKDFEDGVIANKNARILYDKEGNIVLMYLFADENSLIVANKVEAVVELIARVSSSKVKK